jgi:prepilin-type N-terminal cleavage/methylation domain-containing protein
VINRQSTIENLPTGQAGHQSKAFTLSKLPVVRKGFTLIELLVVIAIISLLLSILIPSLNKAKSLAKNVVCLSNLKQLGLSWQLYLGDYRGEFPLSPDDGWFGWGGGDFDLFDNATPLDERPVRSYIDGDEIYKCPSDNDSGAINDVVWNGWGTSYATNGWVVKDTSYRRRISGFEALGLTILIGDTTMYVAGVEGFPGHLGRFTWHSDSDWYSNILFADMHAGTVLIDTTWSSALPGDGYRWLPYDDRDL